MTRKLYNKYKDINDSELSMYELEIKKNGYKMTKELVDKIVRDIVDTDYCYYCVVHVEDVIEQIKQESWEGYDIECVAKHYADYKKERWIDAIDKLTADDIEWYEDDDVDDVYEATIEQIWEVERKGKCGWLVEFGEKMQLDKDIARQCRTVLKFGSRHIYDVCSHKKPVKRR